MGRLLNLVDISWNSFSNLHFSSYCQNLQVLEAFILSPKMNLDLVDDDGLTIYQYTMRTFRFKVSLLGRLG